MDILGIFHSYSDPSAALVRDGKVIAFIEEERLTRVKHAKGQFPDRAIDYVLSVAGLSITDVDCIAQAWDCHAYDSGEMAAHYDRINKEYPTTEGDLAYQQNHLNQLSSESQKGVILHYLRRRYGDLDFPPITFVKHHFAHACMAYFQSGMSDALVLTIDGSGEWTTTAIWEGKGESLELLHEVQIPHSLGWYYAAMTEYLGFEAYDGEYKVMGLAAYGSEDLELRKKVLQLVWYDGKGGFETDPMLLSRGERSYSYYYPDTLAQHFGRPPRAFEDELTSWHMNVAYETQKRLEDIIEEIIAYWTSKTGLRKLCVAGGVGLNVKMNGRLFDSGLLDDIFVHPLCADAGVPIGAAMALEYSDKGLLSSQLEDVYLGPEFSDDEIKAILEGCKLTYTRTDSIEQSVAQLLAEGCVVGWFQGNMEGGPRALGNRSILADPRHIESRDRVNSAIKYRELWRPFCPSMTPEGAEKYLQDHTNASFMILAFKATQEASSEVPAVVHVDGSSRPQVVEGNANPRYYRLIQEFENITGVPCLLNTSFNIKGEPVVCTPQDAIRTFSATGLDALAIGSFLLTKPSLNVNGYVPQELEAISQS